MTFDRSNILISGQGFFLQNLVVIGHSWATWPWLTPAVSCTTFIPIIALHFGQGFSLPNLVAMQHSYSIWHLVDNGWPLHDLRLHHCTTLQSGVLHTKFGGHKAFLKQLWSLDGFDLWWGRFENMLSILVDISPTPIPSFSSIPQSTTKRIAVHTYLHAYLHTHTHTYIQTWIFQ